MPNMSYCRIENTYKDLRDCVQEMDYDVEKLSESEQKYRLLLIELCCQVAAEYSEAEEEE